MKRWPRLVAGLLKTAWAVAVALVAAQTAVADSVTSPKIEAKLLHVEPVGQQKHLWCWAASTQMVVSYLARESRPSEGECDEGWVCEDELWGERECKKCVRDQSSCPEGWDRDADRQRCVPSDFRQCSQAQTRSFDPDVSCCAREWSDNDRLYCVSQGWPFKGYSTPTTEWQDGRRSVTAKSPSLEFTYTETQHALKWGALRQQIEAGHPVIFSWLQPKHVMVAIGYAEIPAPPESAQAGGPAPPTEWVLINDPWPPGSGDGSLIPFEFYRDGKGGGQSKNFSDITLVRE